MDKNIFKNWSLSRVLYFCSGIFFVLIAVNDRVWWMMPFGLYFAVMALFKLGCAGGACEIPSKKEVK